MGSIQDNCHPSWTEIAPNTYRQPYGFQEVLYNAISVPAGSPGLFLVGSAVTFRYSPSKSNDENTPSNPNGKESAGLDLIPRLRNAWLQMRQQYPTLAAENTPDGKVYISPTTADELNSWLETTFLVRPGKTWSEIWKTLVKTRQMTMHFFPEASQLFVQGEHHIVDGRGGMNFWDRFFRALASPTATFLITQTAGAEVVRLPPRSDDLLDMRERSPGRGEQHALELLAPLQEGVTNPIFLPVETATTITTTTTTTDPVPPLEEENSRSNNNVTGQLVADQATSKAIKIACKAQGISVTAAWHAAVVLATQKLQSSSGGVVGTQFPCFGNFDLRRYFPSPETVLPRAAVPDAYNLSNHHCILPHVVTTSPEKTFLHIAREVDSFYQRDLSVDDPELWSALGPMIRMLVPEYTEKKPEEMGSTPALSSFGVADWFISSEYGEGKEWKVQDIWFGNTVTGPWLECFMWSWQGKLCLNSCWNEAYYNEGDVARFHGEVLRGMLEGLEQGSKQ